MTVQLVPTLSVKGNADGHVLLATLKPVVALTPVVAIDETIKSAVPVLAIVTFCVAVCAPNERLAGLSEMPGVGTGALILKALIHVFQANWPLLI